VFDKTGTLTQGKLSLCATHCISSMPRERCLALAVALESASEHPLGVALVSAAATQPDAAAATDVRNVPGAGIEACIASTRYRIGTQAFVAELVRAPLAAPAIEKPMSTRVWLGRKDEWLACFDFEDCLRPDAEITVRGLRDAGKQVMILSGDAGPVVQAVSTCLGVQSYAGGLSPEDKQARVQGLQHEAACIAMVGDGVNDAPVLAQAQLSIAMGSGALMSQAQADMVLLSGRLRSILEALRIAQRTRLIVRQNLAWALGYNVIALPLAFMGLMTPWAAGIGMASSSLLVVLNALRLTQWDEGRNREAPELQPSRSPGPRRLVRPSWTSSTSSSRSP